MSTSSSSSSALRDFLKEALIRILRRPSGVRMSKHSWMLRPWKIEGARHIVVGARTRIRSGVYLSAIEQYAGVRFAPKIVIGSDVYIGLSLVLAAIDEVNIGNGCTLSDHVFITDMMHGLDPSAGPLMQQPLTSAGPVRIGENSFLGYRCCIMPGVTLGRHCVVGAGAVVTHSFPDYAVIAGNPARQIGQLQP